MIFSCSLISDSDPALYPSLLMLPSFMLRGRFLHFSDGAKTHPWAPANTGLPPLFLRRVFLTMQ